jgi:hypothetical protein
MKTVITKHNTTQGTISLISITFNLSDFHTTSIQYRMEGATHHTMFLEQYFVTNKIPLEIVNVNKTHTNQKRENQDIKPCHKTTKVNLYEKTPLQVYENTKLVILENI